MRFLSCYVVFFSGEIYDYYQFLERISTTWKATSEDEDLFECRDRTTGERKWTGIPTV
ncbi:hypothetical protein ACFL7D_05870 [candidate division KSB1 bacterium]